MQVWMEEQALVPGVQEEGEAVVVAPKERGWASATRRAWAAASKNRA
jgi:hypothetical protein